MKLFETLRKPTGMGTTLFLMAVIILSAVIVTGHLALPAVSLLANVAQPICACAVAVLVYLLIADRQLDPNA